jgi:hypothetical protein
MVKPWQRINFSLGLALFRRLLLRQPVKLVDLSVYLPVRGLDLALKHGALVLALGGGELRVQVELRSTRETVKQWRAASQESRIITYRKHNHGDRSSEILFYYHFRTYALAGKFL